MITSANYIGPNLIEYFVSEDSEYPSGRTKWPTNAPIKGFIQEWLDKGNSFGGINPLVRIREEQRVRIECCIWLAERHFTQKELGQGTDLTDVEYKETLQYIQDLREVDKKQPNVVVEDIVWPEPPSHHK